MKKILLTLVALVCATVSYAQIGYQVSLLNTATGEPRANETVTCVIELKNSNGTTICSETKSATSNDFGVISLSVGNDHTFDNMDWSNLPLYVSVSIGGKLVGQSQVLNVPVAEYAKKTGALTYMNIANKKIIFECGTARFIPNSHEFIFDETRTGTYYIDGNVIIGFENGGDDLFLGYYLQEIDTIVLALIRQ